MDYLDEIKKAKEKAKDFKENLGGDQLIGDTNADDPTLSLVKDKTNRVKELLDDVGPGFCLAKWYNVSMHLTHGWTHSCYHPEAHKIPLEELKNNPSALHNTEYKKKVRAQMLNGGRPKECSYCWKVEDAPGNHLSDRPHRSSDVFNYTDFEKAVSENPLVTNFNPRYVEVNFNHACNLKCSYCSPHLSSTWFQEIENEGAYNMVNGFHNDISWMLEDEKLPLRGTMNNPYLEAFWEWWPELYKDIKIFRMTGGEPLIDRNTFKVFDYVIENPKPNLELAVTTNGVPPDNLWELMVEKVEKMTKDASLEHFMLFVSLDSVGEKAEYIRNGLDYKKLQDNIEYFFDNVKERHSLTFINTYNALSVTSHRDFLQMVLNLREKYSDERQLIWFDIPYMHDPKWQSLKNLPSRYDEIMKEDIKFMEEHRETKATRFKGFKDFEVDRLERNLEWGEVKFEGLELQRQRANFYKFFKQHDERRGTDFLKVFPEYQDFWDLCKKQNEDWEEKRDRSIRLNERRAKRKKRNG